MKRRMHYILKASGFAAGSAVLGVLLRATAYRFSMTPVGIPILVVLSIWYVLHMADELEQEEYSNLPFGPEGE